MFPSVALTLLLVGQLADAAPAEEQPARAEVVESSDAPAEPIAEPAEAPTETPAPAAPAPAPEPLSSTLATAAPAPSPPSLEGAIQDVMASSADAVRVAVPPVVDTDAARAGRVQAAVVRVLLDRGREEVVTPSMVSRVLGDAAAKMATGEPAAFGVLSADHVLLCEVVDAAGVVELRLRLIHVETGGTLGTSSAPVDVAGSETSARASTVRGGLEKAVDELVVGIGKLPGDHRYQRIAVAPVTAQGDAASDSRIDRFLQAELTDALAARGFLVVERARIGAAMQQLSLGAMLGEENVGELGKLLDAQAIVVGSVSDAGDVFSLTLRVVGVQTGEVLSAADSQIPREGVVTLASGSVETRSAGEAAFRSLVAPGWGQFYNRQPVKGGAFAIASYGAALTTVGLGIGSAVSLSLYNGYCTSDCDRPIEKRAVEATALREQTDALLTATMISGALTVVIWGTAGADALLDGLTQYE